MKRNKKYFQLQKTYKMIEQTDREAIAGIMASFNFEKVHAYMVFTGWKWRDETPTIDDIKYTASDLLKRAAEAVTKTGDEGACCGTGGLYAYRFIFSGEVCFKLAFEPVHWSNY